MVIHFVKRTYCYIPTAFRFIGIAIAILSKIGMIFTESHPISRRTSDLE